MEIFIIISLILLTSVFAMAEISLISARKQKLEIQANKGDERAKSALSLALHPDTFLSAVQIGITLMSILTGAFSEGKIKEDLMLFLSKYDPLRSHKETIATGIIVISITYLALVTELVAKRIGLSKPEAVAKLVAGPMRVISYITFPFIWLLTKSTNFIATVFSIKANDNHVTEEEIKAIISEGTETGAIDEAEHEIIERVFHLGDRNITSLMTHRSDIIWMDIKNKVADIKQTMREVVHSTYPVCDTAIDNLKGIVNIKEILLADDDTPLSSIMEPGMFVPDNNSAYQVLEKFKNTKNHSCFIVDEYGSIEGMITLNDILEAIVGEMSQTDDDDYEITEREDGSYLVDAQIPFYDFLVKYEKTEWMQEGEQDFDTLAGFILHHLERIPKTGDTLDWKGFAFEVLDMDGHRIDKVLVTVSEEIKNLLE